MFNFVVNFGFHHFLDVMELKGNLVKLVLFLIGHSRTVPATVSLCQT